MQIHLLPDCTKKKYVNHLIHKNILAVYCLLSNNIHRHKKKPYIKQNYLNMWLHNSWILFTFCDSAGWFFCAKFPKQMFLNFTFTSLRHVVQIAVVVLKDNKKKLMWFFCLLWNIWIKHIWFEIFFW